MGPEEGEKQAYADNVRSELLKTYPDMETVTLFSFDIDSSQLEDALFSSSLFSSHTLVLLKHYEQLRKDSPVNASIVRFIRTEEAPATLLVFSSDSPYSLPSSISSCMDTKKDVVAFWEMFDNRKQDWIRSFFRKEGYSISSDAVSYILDMVENNTLEMKNTCSQLALFFSLEKKDRQISLDDISNYVSHTKSEDAYTLFSQIARSSLERSLSCLNKILTTDSKAQMSIVTVLIRQFRLLESFITLLDGNNEEYAFANATVVSSSLTTSKGIRSMRDKQTFRIAAKNYTLEQCQDILLYLEGMDTEIKKAGSEEVRIYLDLMLYTVIVQKGRASSVQLQCELFDNPLSYRKGN